MKISKLLKVSMISVNGSLGSRTNQYSPPFLMKAFLQAIRITVTAFTALSHLYGLFHYLYNMTPYPMREVFSFISTSGSS